MHQSILSFLGGTPACFSCPPADPLRSNTTVLKPRDARTSAAASPAGPAPITATVRPAPSRRGSAVSFSRPRRGLTAHSRGSPLVTFSTSDSMQRRQLMQRMISSARPSSALAAQAASASRGRPRPTKSWMPSASWASACSGERMRLAAMTGMDTASFTAARQVLAPAALEGHGLQPPVVGLVAGRSDVDGIDAGPLQTPRHLHPLLQLDALAWLADEAVELVNAEPDSHREIPSHTRAGCRLRSPAGSACGYPGFLRTHHGAGCSGGSGTAG